MASAAGSSLKDVTMELGGKSPLIICENADLNLAADIAMMANFSVQVRCVLTVLGYLFLKVTVSF